MIGWLKRMIAGRELAELERLRVDRSESQQRLNNLAEAYTLAYGEVSPVCDGVRGQHAYEPVRGVLRPNRGIGEAEVLQ